MKLRDFLGQKQLTQKQFADQIGVSQQSVARFCNGRVPDQDTMKSIFQATDGAVQPNDFYDLDAAPQRQGAAA